MQILSNDYWLDSALVRILHRQIRLFRGRVIFAGSFAYSLSDDTLIETVALCLQGHRSSVRNQFILFYNMETFRCISFHDLPNVVWEEDISRNFGASVSGRASSDEIQAINFPTGLSFRHCVHQCNSIFNESGGRFQLTEKSYRSWTIRN